MTMAPPTETTTAVSLVPSSIPRFSDEELAEINAGFEGAPASKIIRWAVRADVATKSVWSFLSGGRPDEPITSAGSVEGGGDQGLIPCDVGDGNERHGRAVDDEHEAGSRIGGVGAQPGHRAQVGHVLGGDDHPVLPEDAEIIECARTDRRQRDKLHLS